MDFEELSEILKTASEKPSMTVADLSVMFTDCSSGFHLAMLRQPYIDLILSGKKTIESRFMNVRQPPYGKVVAGDLLILKETSGPVLGISQVDSVMQFGPLQPGEAIEVLHKYSQELCVKNDFVELKKNSKYAVLITLTKSISITPFKVQKKDRRAWVVL